MTRYPSKLGIGITLFVVLILGTTSSLMISQKIWIGLLINISVAVFFIYLYLNTDYCIDGKNLIIRSGFLVRYIILIKSISNISETHNPISSPAFSLDRLEIIYNNNENILISPKEKYAFIEQLTKINPNIKVS